MLREVCAFVCVISLLSSGVVYAGGSSYVNKIRVKEDAAREAAAADSVPVTPQISEDEFQRRMKTSKNTVLAGGIVMGVGGAAIIGGVAYLASTPKNSGDEGLSRLATTGVVVGVGSALLLGGGITMLVGAARKSSAKRQYYSLLPVIDPTINSYSLNLAMNF